MDTSYAGERWDSDGGNACGGTEKERDVLYGC
jgi:hypothetical protein